MLDARFRYTEGLRSVIALRGLPAAGRWLACRRRWASASRPTSPARRSCASENTELRAKLLGRLAARRSATRRRSAETGQLRAR